MFLGNNLKTCPNRVQMDQLTFTFVFSKEASSFVRNSNSIGRGVLYQRKSSESLNDIKKRTHLNFKRLKTSKHAIGSLDKVHFKCNA